MKALPLAANSLLAPILERLEHVFPSGDGAYIARCPAHQLLVWLALTETDAGVSLFCFGKCQPAQVMLAIGLSLADLCSREIRLASPHERARALRLVREAKWEAGDQVIHAEAAIMARAAERLRAGEELSAADDARATIAQDVARQAQDWIR